MDTQLCSHRFDQTLASPNPERRLSPQPAALKIGRPLLGAVLMAAGMELGAATPLAARTLDELDTRQQAVIAAWEKGPLTQRRAVFVTAKPDLYGAYDERKSNVFKADEALLTYVEPVGYTWKPVGNGEFQFGVIVDFVVKSKDGKVLGGQEKLLTFTQKSRNKVQELMLNISLKLSGAPAGDYVVAYTIRDLNSPKASTFEQPFTIAN